jgi:lysine N6-hydroxylase
MDNQVFDAVGVGAGPFNLSVAALLHPIKTVRNCFLEKQNHFSWHAGMLLQNTTVQNSFLKDLVSFADPTSPFSFLAFLHEHKRLYQYVNAGFQRTTRREFNQYLQWVAQCLPAVRWGEDVKMIKPHSLGFEVFTENSTYFGVIFAVALLYEPLGMTTLAGIGLVVLPVLIISILPALQARRLPETC